MEIAPRVTRIIRTEMRSRGTTESLSVDQFRSLAFVRRNEGTSLSELAQFIGLTLPSISKLIDGLVERQLVGREGSLDDRRRISLTITERGRSIHESARQGTQESIAQRLTALSPEEQETIAQAMQSLRKICTPNQSMQVEGEQQQNASVG